MENLKQIKTFADACKVEGLDAKKVIPDFAGFPAEDRKAMIAHAKLIIIARAANRLANEGKVWIPDWSNSDQFKYSPWYYMSGSAGFRFGDFGWLGCGFGCRLSPLLFVQRGSDLHW